jgi:hypothetical protein
MLKIDPRRYARTRTALSETKGLHAASHRIPSPNILFRGVVYEDLNVSLSSIQKAILMMYLTRDAEDLNLHLIQRIPMVLRTVDVLAFSKYAPVHTFVIGKLQPYIVLSNPAASAQGKWYDRGQRLL